MSAVGMRIICRVTILHEKDRSVAGWDNVDRNLDGEPGACGVFKCSWKEGSVGWRLLGLMQVHCGSLDLNCMSKPEILG